MGADYRLGHGTENTVYVPKLVQNVEENKCVRVICGNTQTFCITNHACLFMFGYDSISNLIFKTPFVYEDIRQQYRVYNVAPGKHLTIIFAIPSNKPAKMITIQKKVKIIIQIVSFCVQ